MSSSGSPPTPPDLSLDFSWLPKACRPSEQEIDAYAHMIANAEGYCGHPSGARLFREAELQLWIWRAEQPRQRAPKRRRTKSRSPLAA